MAKIFRAIFDDMLPKEDLVELEGRARLPSPQELQGKIILKGSYKREEVLTQECRMHSNSAIYSYYSVVKQLCLQSEMQDPLCVYTTLRLENYSLMF